MEDRLSRFEEKVELGHLHVKNDQSLKKNHEHAGPMGQIYKL